jgi:hypothetical protein
MSCIWRIWSRRSCSVEALALGELARQLVGLLLVDLVLDLLHQRHHVAHAEDARGQPLRMEGLQRVGLLADAR